MKYIRSLLFALFMVPMGAWAASSNDFMVAAQLLSAAKNGDIQQVQLLINNGANVNFVDSTGVSIVCTALMNNDVRAAQILQMYGADASKCDRQIKQYKNRTRPKSSGGLFSGLSSAQSLTLAAAGAAVVVGGLLLLTDVFDPGNHNDKSVGSGDRPGGGGGGTVAPSATLAFTLGYGPATPNEASEAENYANNLNVYSSTDDYKDSFELMNSAVSGYQNYLLMMHGYSAFARGYFGMRTLRNNISKEPINLAGNTIGIDKVLGGRPVNVALVTRNGINAADKPAGEISAGVNALDDRLLPWTDLNQNGTQTNGASNEMISSKYYNNVIVRGTDSKSLTDDSTHEDNAMIGVFDLSGSGTAINNTAASASDNLLAKIVGGSMSGYATADFYGFMPNGQMTIFRTGDGTGFVGLDTTAVNGTYSKDENNRPVTLNLYGEKLTLAYTGDNFVATNADKSKTYYGYIAQNGKLYIASTAGTRNVDQAFELSDDNRMVQVQQTGDIDYKNYAALVVASSLWTVGDIDKTGRTRPDIIANAATIKPLSLVGSATINDVLSVDSKNYVSAFTGLVNQYYNVNTSDQTGGVDDLPGVHAATFFNSLGSLYSPLVIFSTGAVQTATGTIPDGVYPYGGAVANASFENSAPLVFDNLEHLFMSVVAVGQSGNGTNDATSVAGYAPKNKYTLAVWQDKNNTPDDTTDDTYYKARVCGVAGQGSGGVDPWCFAATGVTDEYAVAAAAGAAGVVKSAFNYLDSKQLFTLLALTADGPYLATATTGGTYNRESLIAYLQSLYDLPNEYVVRYLNGEDYLTLFKDVYGYGLINVERATKPGTSVYYYNGNKIVSANGNAYWRAATNTVFRSSAALGARAATVRVPFFDVLESPDGELRMPRIWENEFSVGGDSRRALYMGDVLGDLKTRAENDNRVQIGNMGFAMSVNPRPYYDNFGGLENLRFDYANESWNLAAGYQHYLTDGVSRFSGLANPVLSMASNAIVTDAEYKYGRWGFGARAFTGEITDEGLLENDPTVSAQFNPARLGVMRGGASYIGWHGDAFDFTATVGAAYEHGTLLGAQTGGFLDLGDGRTMYVDTLTRYRPMNNVALTLRSTFARTSTDASGEYVLGISDIDSNAFAIGADVGNFSVSVAQPLAARRGAMCYAYAQYDVADGADGNFDLVVRDTHVAKLNLGTDVREVRFTGAYRHALGEFTDGALGMIYRVHPNNTDEFGNESIFMIKINHRLGI